MKFGNRGHNIPCTDMFTGRCWITSQNHGYAVDASSLPEGWNEWFVNANDGSNEGIVHSTMPYFSVQFHPESNPGPKDTEYLFDEFLGVVKRCKEGGKPVPLFPNGKLPKKDTRVYPKKVLVLGSGGLSIGQAGEFDYSGSQAIKALKQEGIYTVLINPNIATIQTSKGLADKVYFLPVTPEYVRKVIEHEKPDGIYCTFGGQTALNVGVKMKDEFEALGVKVLGTPIKSIELTEDRELFANAMKEIGEKCAQSASAVNVQEAVDAAREIGYPVIVRAAYALGGLGSGFAENEEQLAELCDKAFATSPQVLVERSMKGWKEIEYEVVRDAHDNCITVCNMENFDPLGIHTGDSIVVAPSQTLSDEDYMMLRTTAVNVIRHLGVVGECNIQYALNPYSKEYCIIEVNARLSRSSALASKATGYPLAFVAAKLGLGIPLTEVQNAVTKKTIACFEPSLDYCVVKIPRWDLKKFSRVSTKISSSMKSVGEVMAIGRTFEETIQKAIRAVEYSFTGFSNNNYVENIDDELANPTDMRMFAIAHALHHGYTVEKVHNLTRIDRWFLNKLKGIVELDKSLSGYDVSTVPLELLHSAKMIGMSDRQLATAMGTSEMQVRKLRVDAGIMPWVKQIDTVAAEFPAYTNYLYTTYLASKHDMTFEDHGVMVVGSGVYRIGSSVEFDWCAVRGIRTLRENKIKTIMINYNPETVSTDYDEADRLYFENITLERILDIYDLEGATGVIVSMGGQTPNNIALPLYRQNVKILGTSPEMIDSAENRYKFSRMLDKIGVDQPQWKELTDVEEAAAFCDKVKYPVLVRPSYVLSGAAMSVVYSKEDLSFYLLQAAAVSRDHPVVISKFIEDAKEIEMDAVAKDGKLLMHVISEHVENAGVHSGDATLVLPPQDLDPETVRKIEVATAKIANSLNVTGPFNIQFIAKDNEIKVIECNVRASRSFPFVSKVLGVDLIEMATKAMMNLPVESYPKTDELERKNYVAIKVPQFSFSRLSGADPILGVEMASTGEVASFGKDKYEAYLKSLIATGFQTPKRGGNVLLSIGSFKEKQEFLSSAKKLHDMGFHLFATAGTADFMNEHGIPVSYLEAFDESEENGVKGKAEYSLTQHLAKNMIDLYVNLPSKNKFRRPANYMSRGYRSRRMAVDFAIPLITNIKCAKLFIEALARQSAFDVSVNDYQTSHRTLVMPGLVNMQTFWPGLGKPDAAEFTKISRAALAGGFTTLMLMASGTDGSIADRQSLSAAQTMLRKHSYCDYSLSLQASEENVDKILALSPDVASLAVTLDSSTKKITLNKLASHFKEWHSMAPIIVKANQSDLASILFLANLHKKPVHITGVRSKDDMLLIAMSKENGVKVTCDVAVHNLFFSKRDFACDVLGTVEDVAALWENLDMIDCFSVGDVPYRIAEKMSDNYSPATGLEEALPLLLTAVSDGRLTMAEVVARLSENPRKIFEVPEQSDSYIEVEVDRSYVAGTHDMTGKTTSWAATNGRTLKASVRRVVFNGQTTYLDGTVFGSLGSGRDLSSLISLIGTSSEQLLAAGSPMVPGGYSPRKKGSISIYHAPPSPVIPNLDAHKRRSSVEMPLASLMAGTSGASKMLREPDEAAQLTQSIVQGLQDAHSNSIQRMVPELPSSLSVTIASTPFFRKHILSVKQFNRHEYHMLFGVAHEMRNLVERYGQVNLLNGRVLCTAFYEPSTRTCTSFETAMIRLGGQVVSIKDNTSSIAKGESIGDTVRTLNSYADVIAMRHPEVGSVGQAARVSKCPIINAGDGIGEHPTQAMLDAFTIREELGSVNGLTVTMVGDLKNGRTVHSLVRLLSNYDVKLNYVSPPNLRMPDDLKAEIKKLGIQQTEYETLDAVLATTDVLYVTRVQKERFKDLAEYERCKDAYIINNSVMRKCKAQMIVLHPLPRVNEIDPEVDFDQRAAYFRQMRCKFSHS